MPDPLQTAGGGTEKQAEKESYYDGPFLVFTALFHLKRGYCCGNACRHCPYDANGLPVPGKGA